MNRDFINIIDNAKAGDNKSFEDLYNMTKDSAYFVALSITKNEQDAMDILQDSYIKAFKSLNSLKQPEVFDSWFNRIVANNSKNYITKKKPVLFSDISTDISGTFEEEYASKQNIPHEVIESKETSRIVMDIIDNLAEDKRLIVIMYYYQEMMVKEIAETLDLPETTIKYKLLSARQDMKRDIENLEKTGTKLYSAAPLAIIPSVLAVCASNCTVPAYASVLPSVMAGVGGLAGSAIVGSAAGTISEAVGTGVTAVGATSAGATASAVGATVAGAAALEVAATTAATTAVTGGIAGFLATATGKAIATALAVAVIGGGTATAVVVSNNKENNKNIEITTESSIVMSQETTTDSYVETNTAKESETILQETETTTEEKETKVELSNYTAFEDLTKEMPDTSAMIIDIESGTEFSYDLNNDGKEDNIYYYAKEIDAPEYEVELKINGTDYSDILGTGEANFRESGLYYLIDIDDSDEYVELAIWGGWNAGDRNTSFFRYNGSDLEYIGKLPELVPNEYGFYADGKGTIYFRKDQSLGTSWPTDAKYILNKEGKIEEVKGWRYYSDKRIESIENEYHEILKEVEVYLEPNDNADKIILTKDMGPVKFYITDNEKWVGVINDKNEVYYIKMGNDYIFELENGEDISDILKDVVFFG